MNSQTMAASLGDYFLQAGIVTPTQLESARREQGEKLRSVGRILVERGVISEDARLQALTGPFGYPRVEIRDRRLDPRVLALVPFGFAEQHRVVPLGLADGGQTLIVAMEDPTDLLVMDELRKQTGRRIRPSVASAEELAYGLDQYRTGDSTHPILTYPVRRQHSAEWRLARSITFPLLAFVLPLVALGLALFGNWGGLNTWLYNQQQMGNLEQVDLVFYIGLFWTLWAATLYVVDGIIFEDGEENEE